MSDSTGLKYGVHSHTIFLKYKYKNYFGITMTKKLRVKDKSEKPNIEEIYKEILEREPWVLDDLKKNIEILKHNPLIFEEIKKEIIEREREISNLSKYLN